MKLPRVLTAAFVIGRRDFTATVFSKAFLLFLLGPLFPLLFGVLLGGIGARATLDAAQPLVAAQVTAEDFERLATARSHLQTAFPEQALIRLRLTPPDSDPEAQRAHLLSRRDKPFTAVLDGSILAPRVTGAIEEHGLVANQLRAIILHAQGHQAPGESLAVTTVRQSSGNSATVRGLTARGAQFVLFFLTLMLAGMLLSQLVEEKSNKVIEVLAAAVPVESIFLGKLFAMLAMSLTGIAVWASVAALGLLAVASPGTLAAIPGPAVGWPAFVLLGALYFSMSYLLIGAAFLAIGSQASTVREVQTLSLPVTMGQVMIFAVASAAAGDPDGAAGIAAAVFPLSSPFAMVARAAESSLAWPHLVALGWQALWVAIIIRVASRMFRRSVLKSGAPRRRWFRRAASARSASGA